MNSFSWVVRFPKSKLPVLLHFFTDGGTRELGRSSDVSDRLLGVSESCWLSHVWLEPHCIIPTSSSDPCRVLPPLMSVSQLLSLCWCPLVVWMFWVAGGLGLRVSVERLARSSRSVSSSGWVVDTMKVSPSSIVVGRLLSELPVAREESLWDGYWGQRGRVFSSE